MARERMTPNAENASLAELELAAKVAPTQRAHNRYRAIMGCAENCWTTLTKRAIPIGSA